MTTITVEIDGEKITVEASSGEQAVELAEKFMNLNPEIKEVVKPNSKVKIKAHIPKKSIKTQ